MAQTKKTANADKQAKAIGQRTTEQANTMLDELLTSVSRDEWMSTTKNGALKLTTSMPQLKEDNHGTLKAGGTIYYLVSAGTTKTAILISFRSFIVYKLQLKAIAERLANFPSFDEWCTKQANDWKKLEAVGVVSLTSRNKQCTTTLKRS